MPSKTEHFQRRGFTPGMVIYQISPRSFLDTNGDGVGDLPGIISRLDYVQALGVDAIWLCPFFPSPMVDFGYDVADYCNVDPTYGTMADFDRLVAEAHKRNISVFLDLVVNHTSSEHSWFTEAQSSKTSPKRDWYIWHDGKPDGTPPNNWLSVFDGPAWEYDKQTGQYYFHSFAKQQPDLNWDNPEVREAMKETMRFWLNRGADGFRVDAVDHLCKDTAFRDDPVNPDFQPDFDLAYSALIHTYSKRQPRLFGYVKELISVLHEYPGSIMLFEAKPRTLSDATWYQKYYEQLDPLVAAPLNLQFVFKDWSVASFKDLINGFQDVLRHGDMPVYAFGNHDSDRLATRFGDAATRAAAVLQLTLPGATVVYNGEEIGMRNRIISESESRDVAKRLIPGTNHNRDQARTPMQWSANKNAGFSSAAKTWLPVNQDYTQVNVEAQINDHTSLLAAYRFLINLRHTSRAFKTASYAPLDLPHPELFGFMTGKSGSNLTTIINFSTHQTIPINVGGKMLFSTHRTPLNDDALQPLEARIIETEA